MTDDEKRDKLARIRALSAQQLRGWYQYITTGVHGLSRVPFEGELAACYDRARALGINLSEAAE